MRSGAWEEKMIFVIALMVMFISIICCIKIKKPTVRVILGMVAFFKAQSQNLWDLGFRT